MLLNFVYFESIEKSVKISVTDTHVPATQKLLMELKAPVCPFKLPHPTPSKVKSLLDLLFVILCHFLLKYNSYTVKFNLFEFFSLVIFSVFIRLHLSSLSNSRTSSPLKGTLYSLSVTAPILPSLQPLAITNLHSVFGFAYSGHWM